jgi:CxxC motif-containing protein (DUF1111 family)
MAQRSPFSLAAGRTYPILLGLGLAIGTTLSVALAGDHRHRTSELVPRDVFEGKQLFEKMWEPDEPSPLGGDGLGPLYNEQSCVACHNQGGPGGGGPKEVNVNLIAAVTTTARAIQDDSTYHGPIENLHGAFHDGASIVVHRHATTAELEERLRKVELFRAVQTGSDFKVLRKVTRNAPALFGSGLIDAIPVEVLLAAEKRVFTKFPEIKGRVSELPTGRVGRFGWKAQIASLGDFVRAACSNELGLEVPGHHQATIDKAPATLLRDRALDLNEEQCAALTRYVGQLAPPVRRSPDDRTVPPWGYMVFESIGCATCHAPKLGPVAGIYSDLLLHDMGEATSDAAAYYGGPPPEPARPDLAKNDKPAPPSGPAKPTEWRTPPLWGVAESAPYYHDGRAGSLDEAIRIHAGEAAKASARYQKLSAADRKAVITFLRSLTVSPRGRKLASAQPDGSIL